MAHVFTKDTPVEREFACKCCGEHVEVTERNDHRMCFCCEACEKRYWRHRDRYERRKNTGSGHVVHAWQLKSTDEPRWE